MLRTELQSILEENTLSAEVTYLDREPNGSPDNFIIYYRLSPNQSTYAEGKVHIRRALIQVSHFHKKKLDSIETLMRTKLNIEPQEYSFKDADSDYYQTIYRFEKLIEGEW